MKKLPEELKVVVDILIANPGKMITDQKWMKLLDKYEKEITSYLSKRKH
jgi:hypothetical protein